jgi:hypothetical protein
MTFKACTPSVKFFLLAQYDSSDFFSILDGESKDLLHDMRKWFLKFFYYLRGVWGISNGCFLNYFWLKIY